MRMGLPLSAGLMLLALGFVSTAERAAATPNNEAPPAGNIILNLDGQAIPHSYQTYTASFTAATGLTNLSFAFRDDPAFLNLDNVTLFDNTAAAAVTVVNGDFESGIIGNNAPVGWTYLNIFGASAAGIVSTGGSCGGSGSNCYHDGAVQAYDAISQAIATVVGHNYTLTFDLMENGSQSFFSALSTNNLPASSGNGINLIVFAGDLPAPGDAPEPISLTVFGAGLVGLGLLRQRKRA